ncbi:MAG: BolA family transcriptional regulator [Rickettsiales bacterium]|nr:BolA family transcriptional regulator [Rickettsiales bacterium]
MTRHERIRALLQEKLLPNFLEIIDDSAKHHGHAGASPEGQTHYSLTIEAEAFRGLSRVQTHQMVYKLLEQEFQSGLHALAITARAPE